MSRSRTVLWIAILAFIVAGATAGTLAGQWLTVKVHSPGLEGNLLGDSPLRDVKVYLPPDYEMDADAHYPTVYILHGYMGDAGYFDFVQAMADRLITSGTVQPMIIVAPSGINAYRGSYYTNSSVTGNWEDFIAHDLVAYVDANYRTLPQRESRGIAGYSMGGYGAIRVASRNADIYSAVYAVSACCISFEEQFLLNDREAAIGAASAQQFSGLFWLSQAGIAAAAAFAPNPDSEPFFGDQPLTTDGELLPEVWERWLDDDPLTQIPNYRDNLLRLAISFDVGESDDIVTGHDSYAEALTAEGIPYTYETYPGDHFSGIRGRIEQRVLPFFSEVLSAEPVSSAVEGVTWGQAKRTALSR